MPKLVDSHTHAQFPQFDKDRDEVIKRALDAGIWMVNAGADRESSVKAVELANKYSEGVYAAVGMHPTEDGMDFDYGFFKKLAQDKKVVAIGECGLEYFRGRGETEDDKQKQKELLVKHILLAKELDKPLMIHCREAFGDLTGLFVSQQTNLNALPGIIHFFTGTLGDAKQLSDMGFCFTFGGLITFPPKADRPLAGNREIIEVIKFLPMDKILLETDAPYVAPVPYRGKRNEPAYVAEVAKKLAEIKGASFEEVCNQTTANAEKVFSLQ